VSPRLSSRWPARFWPLADAFTGAVGHCGHMSVIRRYFCAAYILPPRDNIYSNIKIFSIGTTLTRLMPLRLLIVFAALHTAETTAEATSDI